MGLCCCCCPKLRNCCCNLCLIVLSLVVFAIFFFSIPTVGQWSTAKFMAMGTRRRLRQSHSDWVERQCRDISQAQGHIVEIGSGAGGNFVCFLGKDESEIESYVAVEPNVAMHGEMRKMLALANLSFPLEIVTDISEVGSETADYVISTHVLCSVPDVRKMLEEVHRVLKIGGRFAFTEHVEGHKGTLSRKAQDLIRVPWVRFACDFRPIPDTLHEFGELCEKGNCGKLVYLEEFDHEWFKDSRLGSNFWTTVFTPVVPHAQGIFHKTANCDSSLWSPQQSYQ